MQHLLNAFKSFYEELSIDNLTALDQLYDENCEFKDPAHEIKGRDNLEQYFQNLIGNLEYCRFEFSHELHNTKFASIRWDMKFKHNTFAKNKEIIVSGASFFQGTNKIEYHQDYFDLGSMVYEQVSGLGLIIKKIKQKLNSA